MLITNGFHLNPINIPLSPKTVTEDGSSVDNKRITQTTIISISCSSSYFSYCRTELHSIFEEIPYTDAWPIFHQPTHLQSKRVKCRPPYRRNREVDIGLSPSQQDAESVLLAIAQLLFYGFGYYDDRSSVVIEPDVITHTHTHSASFSHRTIVQISSKMT